MELVANHIQISLSGKTIIQDASLSVGSGEFVGIIGPNGSGKTTFLKSIRGLYPLTAGSIFLNQKSLSTMAEKEIAKQMAYMQQQVSLSFGYTAKEIVLTARYPYLRWWESEGINDEKVVENAMKEVGVWHLKDRPINVLSGGERQRVFLAKALAQETELLLLDEPTATLDLVYADEIFRYGRGCCEKGKTILIVVHDLELAAKYCTRLVLISKGTICADGTPEEVLTAKNLKRAFQLSSAVYEDPYFKQQRIFVFPKGTTTIEEFRRGEELPANISIALHSKEL